MKLDLDFQIKSFSGGDIIVGDQKLYAWNAITEVLGGTTKYFKPFKAYALADELYKNKSLNLDSSDLLDLEKEIDISNIFSQFANVWKGPILLAIKTVSEEKPKKNK